MKKKELLALVQKYEARINDLTAVMTYLESDIENQMNDLEQLRVSSF